jgi:hypothetical protein
MPTGPLLWAPDDLLAAHDAWSAGWGDLPFVAFRRRVPAMTQLGVLAHAPWERLDGIRRAGSRSRAARTWGPGALALVDALLQRAGTPAGLADVQQRYLRPLERSLLNAGRMDLGSLELAQLLAENRASASTDGIT